MCASRSHPLIVRSLPFRCQSRPAHPQRTEKISDAVFIWIEMCGGRSGRPPADMFFWKDETRFAGSQIYLIVISQVSQCVFVVSTFSETASLLGDQHRALVLSHESKGESEESHVSDYLPEYRNVQHKAHCPQVELIRPSRANIQRQPRRLGDHKRVLVWNHKEEDKSTRPRGDTRVTTSTKVESFHDLKWSSGDLALLIH